MSDKVDDGGPAYERTLRDEFAGQALAGLLAEAAHPQSAGSWPRAGHYAVKAYEFADAMLAARKGARDE